MADLYILRYHYSQDYMQKRDAYRAAHLARIERAVQDGFILAAGVLPKEPAAVIVCRAQNEKQVSDFAAADPYRAAGLITGFDVDRWVVAAGIDALVQPAQ